MRENLTHGSERGRWKRSGRTLWAPMRGHRLERAETEQPYDTLSRPEPRHRASGLLYRALTAPGLETLEAEELARKLRGKEASWKNHCE